MLILGRLLWPRLAAAPPLPGHLITPLTALSALVWLAKIAALPLTVAASASTGATAPVFALILTALALGAWTRRSAHVGGNHLVEDAVFLGVAAVGLRGGADLRVVLAAVALGIASFTGAAWVSWASWGLRPRLVWMRRPNFRVLGDNPDALTAVGRVRVDAGGWILHLRDVGDGPVTVALLDPAMRPVAHLGWAAIEPALRRDGHLAVGLGTAISGPHLDVPPGRYWLSARFYAPRRRDALPPTLRRAPSWA